MLPPNSSASKSWIKRNSNKKFTKEETKTSRTVSSWIAKEKLTCILYTQDWDVGTCYSWSHKKNIQKTLQKSVQRSACRPIPGRIESSNQIPAKRLGGSQAEAVIWMGWTNSSPPGNRPKGPKKHMNHLNQPSTFRVFFAVGFREGYLAIPTFSLGVRLQEGVFYRRVCYSPET